MFYDVQFYVCQLFWCSPCFLGIQFCDLVRVFLQPQEKDTAVYVQDKIYITPALARLYNSIEIKNRSCVVLTTLCKVTFLLD